MFCVSLLASAIVRAELNFQITVTSDDLTSVTKIPESVDTKRELKDASITLNAFIFRTGGLRFKSLAGQVERSIANGLPPLRHFFERGCVARAQ